MIDFQILVRKVVEDIREDRTLSEIVSDGQGEPYNPILQKEVLKYRANFNPCVPT